MIICFVFIFITLSALYFCCCNNDDNPNYTKYFLYSAIWLLFELSYEFIYMFCVNNNPMYLFVSMGNRAMLSTTWRSPLTPPKSPSASLTTSSSCTGLEKIGNVHLGVFISHINLDVVIYIDAFKQVLIIICTFSPRGDKKAICNKFVQTVS